MELGSRLKIIGESLMHIVYPNHCQICNADLNTMEKHVCLNCSFELPYLKDADMHQAALEQVFWGRVEVNQVFSLFNYQKGNQVQGLLHQLKYHRKFKIGAYFGEVLGKDILPNEPFSYVIPVPLHKKKMKERGFNQSEIIANGIAKVLKVPVETKYVKRVIHNLTQTNFSKYDRYNNVRGIFKVVKPERLIGKHVLLVDDVLTTGATIEACASELLKIKDCKVSIATLAARI